MTEKLYYVDAYIKEFESSVVSCEKVGALYDVVLKETAFFPEEGGQYSDKGTIDGVSVVDVKETQGEIHHFLLSDIAYAYRRKTVFAGSRFRRIFPVLSL